MAAQPAHAEFDTVAHQRADCLAVGQALHLDQAPPPAPLGSEDLRYAGFPHESPKPTIEVSDAALRLANALHLHLD